MKTFVVAVNLAILAAMALVFADHVYGETAQHWEMQVQIERAVAAALLNQ